MKCEKCNKKADIVLPYTRVGFCSKHFKGLMQKRVRLMLRNNNMIDKGEKLGFLLKENASSLICPLLVKRVLGSLPADYQLICFKKTRRIEGTAERLDMEIEKTDKENYKDIAKAFDLDKLIIGRNLTKETDLLIKGLMERDLGKIKTLGPKSRLNHAYLIKPMLKIPKREAEFFAKIENIDFKESSFNSFEKDVHELVEKVKGRRPNTRFSILKIIEGIKGLKT